MLNTLLMLLGALAVLTLGAAPASAMGETQPCHAMAMDPGSAPTPSPEGKAGKAMPVMNCCMFCVAAPALQPPVRPGVTHPDVPAAPRPAALPAGLTPSPEHGPPRL